MPFNFTVQKKKKNSKKKKQLKKSWKEGEGFREWGFRVWCSTTLVKTYTVHQPKSVAHRQYVVYVQYVSVCILGWFRTMTSPFDTGLDHVAGHELEPALQVFAKLLLRPVQVSDERLKRVKFPEEVLRGPWAITAQARGQGVRGYNASWRSTLVVHMGLENHIREQRG